MIVKYSNTANIIITDARSHMIVKYSNTANIIKRDDPKWQN
jgi:hypothetical protein